MNIPLGRLALLASILAGGALSTACIESETHATIVLEPGGSGRWVVLQREIHAVADTPEQRMREEEDFMSRVSANAHSQAAAFRALGATGVTTQVVSAEWPYAVQTEARFADLSDLFARFIELCGMDGRTSLVRDGDLTTFTAVIRTDAGDHQTDDQRGEDGPDAASLVGERGPVFFIRHGQFVSATGFTLSDDGRVARPDDMDDSKPEVTLSLTWTEREAVAKK